MFERLFGGRLPPLVYLADNWISQFGMMIVTTATVLWLFLLPTTLRGEVQNPYIGILSYMALPGFFFGGLFIIPPGMLWKRRREQRSGRYPQLVGPLTWANR